MTNFSKLVSWNRAVYDKFTDSEVCVKLTERQIYILAQFMPHFTWKTRWVGDTSDLDLDAIGSELMHALFEIRCEGGIVDCEQVEDCLESSETIGAINTSINTIGNNGGIYVPSPDVSISDNPYSPDAVLPIVYDDSGTCDYDYLYGQIVALWGYINQKNIDFLEMSDAASNLAERVGDLIEAIPLVGELPFDDAAQIASKMGEYSLDAYNAALTPEFEQALICDIFCMAQDNCAVTYHDFIVYFSDLLAQPSQIFETFTDLILLFVTGSWVSTSLIYILSLIQLSTVYLGTAFFDTRHWKYYAMVARAGDPDSDHEIFCLECSWISVTDWTTGSHGWTVNPSGEGGTLTANGLETVDAFPFPSEQGAGAEIAFDDTAVTTVRCVGNIGKVRSGAGGIELSIITTLDGVAVERLDISLAPGAFDVTLDVDNTIDKVRIRIQTDDDPPRSWFATTTMKGSDTKPAQLP